MSNALVIEFITSQDVSWMAQLHQKVFPDAWDATAFEQLLLNPHVFGLKIPHQHGFILIQQVGQEYEILTFAVDPEIQGQGLGSHLLYSFLERCAPGASVYLEVSVLNKPAIHLYQRFGFQEISRRQGYYRYLPDPTAICFLLTIK